MSVGEQQSSGICLLRGNNVLYQQSPGLPQRGRRGEDPHFNSSNSLVSEAGQVWCCPLPFGGLGAEQRTHRKEPGSTVVLKSYRLDLVAAFLSARIAYS